MNNENPSLEAATQRIQDAQETLNTARRNLSEAILNAYANGESVARIAERTGRTTLDIWNTLAAHGITRSTHINASQPTTT
ncbi:hypothetical protein ADK75_10175 [Streptomyces virginiae]|uniref:Uncharacterized protein n=1 Tax=Streptomyces virginiae TaxID=1961 RepID=A0A0L8MZ42_STRVG|nr:hypothetical protein [Streptomyces virginiae]KOG55664.1 hypothetical protein ADK75_10175 [Streptomyces virginiae]